MKYNMQSDVKVICVTAKSFPEGIQEAFITLDKMLSKEGRTFYGVSYKNASNDIVYKAAVTEVYDGEAEQFGFKTFIIQKGEYLTETIMDWRTHIENIGKTFQRILEEPLYDETFPCVEWYKSDKEVLCMVKSIAQQTK